MKQQTEINEVLHKLQKAKVELKKYPLKKSGYNKFNNYKYYELDDILPAIMEVLLNNKLSSYCYPKRNKMYIEIHDYESKQYITFSTKLKEFPTETNKKKDYGAYMKTQQGLQTYARRALWLIIMDISEPNDIDATPEPTSNPKKPTIKTNNSNPPKSKTEPITEEQIKEILDATYEKLTAAEKEFNISNADWTIKRLCNGDNKLYHACIDALEVNQYAKS